MGDDSVFRIAGPGGVWGTRFEGDADRVDARDKGAGGELSHPGHELHVEDNVGGIGDLNPDFRGGGTEGAHAVRDHIHRAPFHAAFEELAQVLVHGDRVFPVVGGACLFFTVGANEGGLFDARHIVWIGVAPIATRAFEWGEFFLGDHLACDGVELFI